MRTRMNGFIAAIGLLAAIVLANYVTTRHGFVSVGFGLEATAGTYLAGVCFVFRDAVHDALGKRGAVAVIALGAVLSFLVSDPFIALASGVAFLVSELADLLIYIPLRTRGYVRAALASNVVGSFVDTLIFLAIAGFPVWVAVPGQMVGKFWITLAVVLSVAGVRFYGQRRSIALLR